MNEEQKRSLLALENKDGVEAIIYLAPDGSLAFLNDPETKVACALGLKVSDVRKKLEKAINETALCWLDAADPASVAEEVVAARVPEVIEKLISSRSIVGMIQTVMQKEIEAAVRPMVEEAVRTLVVHAEISVVKK